MFGRNRKIIIFLTSAVLAAVMISACGKKRGKAQFTKVKRGSPEQQQKKIKRDLAEIFDVVTGISSADNPVAVMNAIEAKIAEKLDKMATKSKESADQINTWHVSAQETMLKMTMNTPTHPNGWLQLTFKRDGQKPQIEDLECERRKQAQKEAGNNTGQKAQSKATPVKCDTYESVHRCLGSGSVCENLLILVYNVNQGFVLPIFHRYIKRAKVEEQEVLQVPLSIKNPLGADQVATVAYEFQYTAMVFNQHTQDSELAIEGTKKVKNTGVSGYEYDQPAEITISPKQ